MSAAAILPKFFPVQYVMPIIFKVQKVTQSDWINLSKAGTIVKGVVGVVANVTPVGAAANVAETLTYGPADIANGGTAYTATDTTIAVDGMLYDGINPRIAPYYLLTGGGEILEVIADSLPLTAASTLTVKRGCLGTTATATGLANNDRCAILNQVVLGASAVGFVSGRAEPLPTDSGTKPFA
jgi:hypothetical protein